MCRRSRVRVCRTTATVTVALRRGTVQRQPQSTARCAGARSSDSHSPRRAARGGTTRRRRDETTSFYFGFSKCGARGLQTRADRRPGWGSIARLRPSAVRCELHEPRRAARGGDDPSARHQGRPEQRRRARRRRDETTSFYFGFSKCGARVFRPGRTGAQGGDPIARLRPSAVRCELHEPRRAARGGRRPFGQHQGRPEQLEGRDTDEPLFVLGSKGITSCRRVVASSLVPRRPRVACRFGGFAGDGTLRDTTMAARGTTTLRPASGSPRATSKGETTRRDDVFLCWVSKGITSCRRVVASSLVPRSGPVWPCRCRRMSQVSGTSPRQPQPRWPRGGRRPFGQHQGRPEQRRRARRRDETTSFCVGFPKELRRVFVSSPRRWCPEAAPFGRAGVGGCRR